ncbi:MAG: hypothetical protein ACOH2A_15675 [Sphingobacteriaceae bacterium]
MQDFSSILLDLLKVSFDLKLKGLIIGLKYLPSQGHPDDIISHYQFYVSGDHQQWKTAAEGGFSNIQNKPL